MYKVIFTKDTKGKDAEIIFIGADNFAVVVEKGFRYVAFFAAGEMIAMFAADKITAIYKP